jgi:hypothetical protein
MSVKTILLGFMVVGAVLGLAACNGENGDGGTTPTSDSTSTAVPSPPPELCPKLDDEVVQSMVAVLEVDKSSYKQGKPIKMTLRLVNCASKPITRNFPDAQRYDFSVKKKDGDEVWRWSKGMAFEEVEAEETYQPAEQVTFVETWDQLDDKGKQVKPGQYEVTAESTGCDKSLENCGPKAIRYIKITAP